MPNYSHGTKLALAAADEPPFLTVGTDVSAKYKGAFCEAKIIEVSKNVKVRVLFDGGLGNHLIDDTDLKVGSTLEVGAKIEAKHPEKKQQLYFAASITKILDHSRYTVVFDDGDRSVLRRSSICLKSGKHFAESETLDQLPLTNPEHFGNPVKVGQTIENASNQNNCNNNNNNGNHNNNTNHIGHQANQSGEQSSSKLDNHDPGESKSNSNNNNINKSLSSDNKSTPANGRATSAQSTIKQETSDKSAPKTKTASATTPSNLNTPGRRGGKGRRAKDSLAGNSKLTDMVDDHEDSSQDSADPDSGDTRMNSLIEVGVKLMVQYGKGKIQNVYEAKVNKIETNSAGKTRYFVHYTGWNNRYDEWVTKNRILSVITDKENGVRDGRSKHLEATNSTSSSITASSNSSTKESSSVKEKDVSTPAKNPRRSRLVDTASTVTPSTQTSTPVTASNSTLSTSTVATTPARERDKSKDKNKEVPTKTRRTRNIVDSSANSTTTSSSASSTCSVVSATGQNVVKDEPKEKETASAITAPSKSGRPRLETRESMASTNSSSANLTKERDKEPPTKTRRSKQAEAISTSINCVVATNEPAAPSSPSRLATVKTEHDKVKNSVKDTQHSATKEDRSEKPQHSESVPTVKSRSTTQSNQLANITAKEKEAEKELICSQPTKSRGSRQSESSAVASSNNSVLSSAPTSTTTSTTTKVATATLTVATTTATSIASPVTSSLASAASPIVAQVTSRPTRDRERDKESDKEPPTKIRRSRQAASESSEKASTSNAATSASVSTTTTSSSTNSSNVNVANPSTASSASSSSSSSSSYSLTFSSNVMSAYNMIDKERFSDLPIIDEPDCDKRISILQDKIMAIKQTYMALRSELADLDRRKKRPRLERSNSDHINFSGVTCRN